MLDISSTRRANLRYNQALGLVRKQVKAYSMSDTVRPVNWRYICHAEVFLMVCKWIKLVKPRKP